MEIPPGWEAADPKAAHSVGHQPDGRTVMLHSLAVSPTYQRGGLGKALMRAYLARVKETGLGDRVAILTYDRLVPYYQGLGFEHYGKSKSNYAGVAWHDLVSLVVRRGDAFLTRLAGVCVLSRRMSRSASIISDHIRAPYHFL